MIDGASEDWVASHKIVGTYPLPAESAGSTLWLDGVYTVYVGDGNDASGDEVVTYATGFDGRS